jgi:DNA-directed RNA polymerase subunit H (RpoH/RPB5)
VKRSIVFFLGLASIAILASYLVPANTHRGGFTFVARLAIDGSAASDRERFLSDQALKIVSPSVVQRAILIGRLDELASYKDGDIAALLTQSLSATRWEKGESIIEVKMRCRSKADGRAALQAILDAFVEYSTEPGSIDQITELRTEIEQMANHCVVTLESQMAQRKKLVMDSPYPVLDDYDALLKEHANTVSRRTRLLTQREAESAALRARGKVLRAAVDETNHEEVLSLFALNDSETRQVTGAGDIVKQLLPLFQEKKELLKRVGQDHPDVLKVDRKISAAREFLGKAPDGGETSLWDFLNSYISALELQQRMLDAEIAELENGLRAAEEKLRGGSEFAVRERQLREAIATTKKQFDLLAAKVASIVVSSPIHVQIVEPPRLDEGEQGESSMVSLFVLGLLSTVVWLWVCSPWRSGGKPEAMADGPVIRFSASDNVSGFAEHETPAGFGTKIRELVAVIRLANFCEDRNQVVIRAEEDSAGLIAENVRTELQRAGIAVDRDGPPQDADSRCVQVISDHTAQSIQCIDPLHVIYVEFEGSHV